MEDFSKINFNFIYLAAMAFTIGLLLVILFLKGCGRDDDDENTPKQS